MTATGKPLSSLSLDLDNEWSYIKTHGDPNWTEYPSYLDLVVPRFLDLFERIGQRITVFIVGKDASMPNNRNALRAIADAGHEIGNHSYRHEPWLHRYSREELETEIGGAAEAIEAATGKRPVGFRGPGYSLSVATLETLHAHGYHYDCSTLPTYIGPLARAYYFMTAKLTPEQREERKSLFGGVSDGFRPLKPYSWDLGGSRSIVEIPVTTYPLVKVPIHFSYILYAAQVAPALAMPYFRSAMLACRATGLGPSLLLHPLDFLDGDDVKSLAFFPAMRMKRERKLALIEEAVGILRDTFEVVPVGDHASAVAAKSKARRPDFA